MRPRPAASSCKSGRPPTTEAGSAEPSARQREKAQFCCHKSKYGKCVGNTCLCHRTVEQASESVQHCCRKVAEAACA